MGEIRGVHGWRSVGGPRHRTARIVAAVFVLAAAFSVYAILRPPTCPGTKTDTSCVTWLCVDGDWQPAYTAAGAACAGAACTYGTTCDGAGTCGGGGTVTCSSDACTSRTCNGTATCTVVPKPVNTSCSDGNACNGLESCDGSGTCRPGTPPVVDDGNVCTTDSCDPGTGVMHTPLASVCCVNGVAQSNACCANGTPLTSVCCAAGAPLTGGCCATGTALTGACCSAGVPTANGTVCSGDPTATLKCDGTGICVAATLERFLCYDKRGNVTFRHECASGAGCAAPDCSHYQ